MNIRRDISNPVTHIICSKSIFKHIEKEPCFRPLDTLDIPDKVLNELGPQFLETLKGALYIPKKVFTTVTEEPSTELLKSVASFPIPYQLLNMLLPGVFQTSFWKDFSVVGDIFPLDSEANMLAMCYATQIVPEIVKVANNVNRNTKMSLNNKYYSYKNIKYLIDAVSS